MKLAMISPDRTAVCLICSWAYRAPSKIRGAGAPRPLTQEEVTKVLQENLFYHLRHVHDRLLLTREEVPSKEEGVAATVYFNGRRPEYLRY